MDSSRTGNLDGSEDLVRLAEKNLDIPEFIDGSSCLIFAVFTRDGDLIQSNAGSDYVFFSDFGDDENISESFVNPIFSDVQHRFDQAVDGNVIFEGVINVGNPALMVHSLNGRIIRFQGRLLVVAEHDVQQLINLNQKVVDLNNELANAHRKMAKMNREIKAEKKRTEQLLITDQLTQAPNRYALNQRMDEELARYQRYHQPMSFALLDIDKFKLVNDEYGHDVGDQALIYLADWLKGRLRKSDFFARWGGEEFVIMFPGTGVEEAQIVLNRIREELANEVFEPIGRPLTFSAGILEFEFSMSLDDIFKRADQALYTSKERGRNQITRAEN